MNHFYQEIPGWFDFQSLYREAVERASDGAHFVEVGAWLGRSTAFMVVEIVNSGKTIQFDVIDTFEGTESDPPMMAAVHQLGVPVMPVFLENMRSHGVVDRLTVFCEESSVAASRYPRASLDFVFIDADHYRICEDLQAWYPAMKPGACLAGHDWNYCGQQIIRELAESHKTTAHFDGNSWIVEIP